nr:haloacid dehalogenase-like hydrolase [Chiayiivirga flava]
MVVFDFDNTLVRGDSGGALVAWLLRRSPWRTALAVLAAVVLGPMIAMLPTRRVGISGFVWIATFGLRGRRDFDTLIDDYVLRNEQNLRGRILPQAIDVLHRHREAGDRVVVATGAPPELARAVLAFVAHEDVPVVGTQVGRRFGAVIAQRHCHAENKLVMLREAGFDGPIVRAYTDSTADMPLLRAARHPVVVNPKPSARDDFRKVLGGDVDMRDWGARG